MDSCLSFVRRRTHYLRLPRGRAGASGRDILFRRVTRRVGQYRFGGTSDFISSD